MTDINQLVEVGARAQMASAAYSSFWSVTDHKVMIKEGILAILPLLADDLAGVIQRRMDERFAEHGTREPDTNATYYSGRAGELYESLDEEDEEIAHAIRTRIAAIIEGEGK